VTNPAGRSASRKARDEADEIREINRAMLAWSMNSRAAASVPAREKSRVDGRLGK
jgi:hypothetical protein